MIDPTFFPRMEGASAFEYAWDPWEHPPNRFPMAYSDVKLYGLPKVVGESEFTIGATSGSVRLDYEGKRMAELTVSVPGAGRPRRIGLPFKTLTVLEGRIIETNYETIAVGHLRRSGDVDWRPGEHPRFARFVDLDLSRRPVEVRVIPRLNWIIWGPRDRGPL